MSVCSGKLTPKQEKAIAALLSEPTIAEAAKVAGVGESTLRRWLQEEHFTAAYSDAKRQAMHIALGILQQKCAEAVMTLQAVMTDQKSPPSSRVSAAKTVLDTALKAVEIQELEERIAALENGR